MISIGSLPWPNRLPTLVGDHPVDGERSRCRDSLQTYAPEPGPENPAMNGNGITFVVMTLESSESATQPVKRVFRRQADD